MKYDGGLNPVQHLQIHQNNNEISRLYMNDHFSKCKNIPHRSKNSLTDFLPTFWFSVELEWLIVVVKNRERKEILADDLTPN